MLHPHSHRMPVLLGGLALMALAAAPAAAQSCTLAYQRADNMWAAAGRPDGNLGTETITLPAGGVKSFITSWFYEKRRNDGLNYYGSHLRIATNTGTRQITVVLRSQLWVGDVSLPPGQSQQFQHDLVDVRCE